MLFRSPTRPSPPPQGACVLDPANSCSLCLRILGTAVPLFTPPSPCFPLLCDHPRPESALSILLADCLQANALVLSIAPDAAQPLRTSNALQVARLHRRLRRPEDPRQTLGGVFPRSSSSCPSSAKSSSSSSRFTSNSSFFLSPTHCHALPLLLLMATLRSTLLAVGLDRKSVV